MRPEEHLDQLLEQQRLGTVPVSALPADVALRLAAADTFARLNAIEVPSDVAQRIEARVRIRAAALQAESQRAHQQRLPLRQVSRRPVFGRAWIAALGAVAILVLAFVGLGTAAANSLPGDPLYGIRQWEQHVAVAWTSDQAARASLQLTQVQQALADLETVVREHRSDAAIAEALSTVAAGTQDSQQAVHALPKGASRVALAQTLATTLVDERTSLHRLLSQTDWKSRVAFTRQLGVLGEAVPSITGVTASWDSDDTLTLTITGKHFAPGARLVIDGSPRGSVVSASATTMRVEVRASDWPNAQMDTIGIMNPDGTAAQVGWGSGPQKPDQWGPGNHHSTPGPTPGHGTPWPGNDNGTPGMGRGTPWPGNNNGTPWPGMHDH